ncbi:MAG TPA: SirB2 family protein [Rhodocyclaceae bacterium]
MYLAIKHLHVTCALLSGTGLLCRGLLMISDSPLLQRRWVRTLPHINDTLLLAAAVALTVLIGQYPFVDAWLTAKVFGVIAYIILGALALRPRHPRALRVAALCAAMAVFGYVVSVALTKSAWGLLTAPLGG